MKCRIVSFLWTLLFLAACHTQDALTPVAKKMRRSYAGLIWLENSDTLFKPPENPWLMQATVNNAVSDFWRAYSDAWMELGGRRSMKVLEQMVKEEGVSVLLATQGFRYQGGSAAETAVDRILKDSKTKPTRYFLSKVENPHDINQVREFRADPKPLFFSCENQDSLKPDLHR